MERASGLVPDIVLAFAFKMFSRTWSPSPSHHAYVHTLGWRHRFANSLKMKMAVTVGVVQMAFGLVLSVFNHVHNRDYLSIVCEFVPQLLFLMALFGYMVTMVIIKWSIDWSVPVSFALKPDGTPCFSDRPNLITTMCVLVLSGYCVSASHDVAAVR